MENVALKRPDDFRMGFQSKADSEGVASIYVAAFRREHIPFLLKALAMADKILACDDRTETAQEQPIPTETNVNEQGTEGDSGTNRLG